MPQKGEESRNLAIHTNIDHLLGGVKVVMGRRAVKGWLAVVAVGTVPAVPVIAVVPVPVITITTVWRSRALASVAAVTLVVAVTLPAVILPGRVVAGTTRARGSAARRTRRAAIAVTARIESP